MCSLRFGYCKHWLECVWLYVRPFRWCFLQFVELLHSDVATENSLCYCCWYYVGSAFTAGASTLNPAATTTTNTYTSSNNNTVDTVNTNTGTNRSSSTTIISSISIFAAAAATAAANNNVCLTKTTLAAGHVASFVEDILAFTSRLFFHKETTVLSDISYKPSLFRRSFYLTVTKEIFNLIMK